MRVFNANLFRIASFLFIAALVFLCIPAIPALADEVAVDPTEAEVGDTVEVTGDSFTPDAFVFVILSSQDADLNDDITVEVTSWELLDTIQTNSISGDFVTDVVIPDELNDGADDEDLHGGVYYIYVTYEGNTNIEAKTEILITGFTPEPVYGLSPINGSQDIPVTGIFFSWGWTGTNWPDGYYIELSTSPLFNSHIIGPLYEVGLPYLSFSGTLEYNTNYYWRVAAYSDTGGASDWRAAGFRTESEPVPISVEITIDTDEGPVGTEIEIEGDDFTPGEDITVWYGLDNVTSDVSGDAETNSQGEFSVSLVIPESIAGDHLITVIDETGTFGAEVFTVEPLIGLNIDSGPTGTRVRVEGTGFGYREDIDSVVLGVTDIAIFSGDDDTDNEGSFDFTFIVPNISSGIYTLTVEDEDGNEAEVGFTVEVLMEVDQITTPAAPGHVGSEITITGSGFNSNALITVTYTSEPVIIGNTATDSSGNFSITVEIPASTGGLHTISVSDGSNTENFDYFMEEYPPDAPTLATPQTGTKPEQPVAFDWNDVSDISGPVTYILQVATDGSFTTLAVPEKELSDSGYKMSTAEKLPSTGKDSPYYWRVRAVDSAGNESSWSGNGTFTVGIDVPVWAWVVIGGLGALLLILIAFYLGRRGGKSSF